MDLMSAGQIIKDTVSMQQVLDLYGYPGVKNGFMRCPFHAGDRTASLKVYTKQGGHSGWHCFGCGRGGSVIDFVMEHEHCDFRLAVMGIDRALQLGLLAPENPYKAEDRKRLQGALDALETAWLRAISAMAGECDVWLKADLDRLQMIEDIRVEDRTAQQWTEHDMIIEEMEWLEYKKRECDLMREEVREWRKNQRRAGAQRA